MSVRISSFSNWGAAAIVGDESFVRCGRDIYRPAETHIPTLPSSHSLRIAYPISTQSQSVPPIHYGPINDPITLVPARADHHIAPITLARLTRPSRQRNDMHISLHTSVIIVTIPWTQVQLPYQGRMGGVSISSGTHSSTDSWSVVTSSADAVSTCLYDLYTTTHYCRHTLMMILCPAVTWWLYALHAFGVGDCFYRLADRANSFPIDISWVIPIIHHHRHTLSALYLSSRSISHNTYFISNYLAGTYQLLHIIIVYHTWLLRQRWHTL